MELESASLLLQRRRWLALAAASAAGGVFPSKAWSQPRWRSDPFALGVASGNPAADSVVLWTRIAPQALPADAGNGVVVQWELADDAAFSRIRQRGNTQALAELGWSVHVEPAGLEPNRHYFYRFHAAGATSTVGRTRTLPASTQLQPLTLAYASCQKWEDGYFTAWRHLRQDAPDVVLFLGDYIYEYPGTSSKLRTPGGGWVLTLQQYRARYALYKTDPDLQAMHAACPWVLTWDDHEVQNDYAGVNPGDGVPPGGWDALGFLGRRAAAYQAYYENMPLRASVLTKAVAGLAQGAEMRIYGRLDWGRLASLYLLDTRQYKDAQACTKDGKLGSGLVSPGRCPAWADPQRSMLGLAQEQWLQAQWAQAASRGSVWNVLCQSTLLGQRDFAAEGSGQRLWNDGWDGYAAARSRLTQALQTHRVANPVVLGGDVHENWVGHVLADYARPDSAVVGVEFCGTSITSHAGREDRTAQQLERNPHFVFADSRHRGYGLARFDERQLSVQLRVLDDVTRQDASISTLAGFRVLAGVPRVERTG
ncbi:alkaline phosphatase D family protein [Curvibacter sp. APW13]|uniref:alkaline phosphatase D family protein n=1 Tax=Curvibacter sp. APW13 TaxID=3077236 RepID=UPI0028E0175B|nr:alkaline phosphatase D family protein [Curvibacter sp. APW13]MDT8991755.1 alkaline phosphatase D family protein [Curvibacter sp. APW13]